jgi:hypothetical protein
LKGLGNGPQATTDKADNASTKFLNACLKTISITAYINTQETMSPRISAADRMKI